MWQQRIRANGQKDIHLDRKEFVYFDFSMRDRMCVSSRRRPPPPRTEQAIEVGFDVFLALVHFGELSCNRRLWLCGYGLAVVGE
jgi:hypothetical protein